MNKIKDIRRITQVVRVLLKQGFGKILYDHGLRKYLPFHKRVMMNGKLPSDLPVKIRLVFEELGGAYVKLGQLLSLRPDLIPQEYCDELKKLQDQVPPFPFNQAMNILENEVGKDVFLKIDEKPIGSASIAQVHRAKLKNNQDVVIKIQRPYVKDDFETDIDIMYYIAHKLEKKFEEFSPIEIVKEFENYTKKELNFVNEAKNIDRFYQIFSKDPHVRIPSVYWHHTTKNVLVMEYLRGKKISELKDEKYDKKKIAETIVEALMKQVYEHGVFHADLHPGNILVVDDDKISLLDFGIVGVLNQEMKTASLNLFVALINRDTEEVIKILLKVGTQTKYTDLPHFKNDIESILSEWFDQKLKMNYITKVIYDLVNTCIKYKIKLPIEIILYAKSFLTAEGTCKSLVPDFNFINSSQPHVIRILEKENTPKKVLNRFIKKSKELSDAVLKIPGEAFELLEKLKTGRFSFDLEDTDIKHLGMDINMSSNRLSYAIVIAALIVGGSMLTELRPQYGGYSVISLIFLSSASIMLALLLISVRREGTQKYDHHRKL
ncbi:AarF/ABC1/UbiB kinase family protein [Candidatus Woesearchaeota archaeon]|nr:AarF/ABC1/UbiB kinase family protein [Candidatus Woesearchaeota archaeon]